MECCVGVSTDETVLQIDIKFYTVSSVKNFGTDVSDCSPSWEWIRERYNTFGKFFKHLLKTLIKLSGKVIFGLFLKK